MFGKFPDRLESFRVIAGKFPVVWKAARSSEKFADNLERFWMGLKGSGWSEMCPDNMESFRMVSKVSVLSGKFLDCRKVSRLSGKFLGDLERFRMVWKVFS